MRFARIFAFLLFSLNLAACSDAQEAMRLPVDADILSVESASGEKKAEYSLEIARTGLERSAGLMHRTDLPEDRAMLFVFPDEEMRYFWMQNTPTPLDIIYADARGVIVHVSKDTKPFSTDPIPSQAPARYVLEIHAGQSGQFGIKTGDILRHREIGAENQ